jgi:hypothetical protein
MRSRQHRLHTWYFNQGQAVSGLTVGLALLTQINAPGDSGYLITKIL